MRGKTRERVHAPCTPNGFNEAPAECGGKLRVDQHGSRGEPASMRPPQNAGENYRVWLGYALPL